jgi:hypothetical protein
MGQMDQPVYRGRIPMSFESVGNGEAAAAAGFDNSLANFPNPSAQSCKSVFKQTEFPREKAIENRTETWIHIYNNRGGGGSMLLSQFLPIFGENIGVFFKKYCYEPIFGKISRSLSTKAPIFSPNCSAKIFLKS